MALNKISGKQLQNAIAGGGLGLDAQGNIKINTGNGVTVIDDTLKPVFKNSQELTADQDGIYINQISADKIASGQTNSTFSATDESNLDDLVAIRSHSLEPSGFVNRTDSTISYTLNTRTITISGTYTYYYKGTKYTRTSVTESVQHGTDTGVYFIYYNGATLTCNPVNTAWAFSEVQVIALYYNGTAATTLWDGPEAILFEERHGFTMDWVTHSHLHNSMGTIVKGAGFALNGTYAVATGTGTLADVTYGVDSGTICDEDIDSVISQFNDNEGVGNQYPVFYRTGSGTEWRWYVNNIPLLSGTNIYYNQNITGTWQFTEISNNNRFVNMYICAVPFHSSSSGNSFRFIWIMGQILHSSLAAAQAESFLTLDLTGWPFTEVAPIWQIVMRRDAAYANDSGNSRIESTKKIVGTQASIAITGSPTNHNNLSGRNDPNSHLAGAIATTTTNFDGMLSSVDTDTQLALDTIDAFYLPWTDWVPTESWTTGTPATNTVKIARYNRIGKTVFFNLYYKADDGNGATDVTFTLPIAPKDNNSYISCTGYQIVDTTKTNPIPYIDDSATLIKFRSLSTATDNTALEINVTGSYEIS